MAENPDSETLVSLLKDKAKELKLIQKKLTLVEDKFVSTLKLQKSIKRDRDTFEQFLKSIFPQAVLDDLILQDVPDNYGLYDINQLNELYT
jgi:hypothetical protein